MKTLHLLRHAKAAEGNPEGTDHSRPLAKRGVKAADALAEHMRAAGFSVERVFCSTSARTRETYERVAPALKDASIAFRDRLYLVDTSDLIDFIQGLPDSTGNVMIIGHNPTFHVTALKLIGKVSPGHEDDFAVLSEKFPTGSLCSLRFEVNRWRDVKSESGTLTDFVRPRDLDGDA